MGRKSILNVEASPITKTIQIKHLPRDYFHHVTSWVPAPNGKIHIVRDKVNHNIWRLWDLDVSFWVNLTSLKIIQLIIYQCLFFLDDDGNDGDDGKHEDYDNDGDGSGDDEDRAFGPPSYLLSWGS